jgi:hypothetical protein
VRVVLKFRPRIASWTACPQETFWEPERLSSLSRAELSEFSRHCQRCAMCDAKRQLIQPAERALEAASSRVAVALLSSVLLVAALRFHPARHTVFEDSYAFLPTPDSVQRLVTAHADTEEAVEEAISEPEGIVEEKSVGTRRSVAVSMFDVVGPKRVFIAPTKKRPVVQPLLSMPPPPVITTRVEAPRLPVGTPSLQPPRSKLKKFVSVLAVPFRHI